MKKLLSWLKKHFSITVEIVEEEEVREKDQVKIGDIFVDDEWQDTVIEVVQLNRDGKKVRYRYLQIDGKPIKSKSVHTIKIKYLLEDYCLKEKGIDT
jgi:hypothetical protein